MIAKKFYMNYSNSNCLIFKHVLLNDSEDIKHDQNFSQSYNNSAAKSINESL